jgi:hypothetical protein
MKKPALVLLALLCVLPFAQAMAQTPAPVPDTAQFLASLADGQAPATSDLIPAPSFTAGCTSTAQCPTGQLCCWVCGNPPLTADPTCKACVTPIKGRCPLVV